MHILFENKCTNQEKYGINKKNMILEVFVFWNMRSEQKNHTHVLKKLLGLFI